LLVFKSFFKKVVDVLMFKETAQILRFEKNI